MAARTLGEEEILCGTSETRGTKGEQALCFELGFKKCPFPCFSVSK